MPIRFRCTYCNRLLGIATRKAGMETTCPHCGYAITVPVPQAEAEAQDARTERLDLGDVDELLGNAAADATAKSAVATPAAPPSPPPAPEKARVEVPKPAATPTPPVQKAKPAPAPKTSVPASTNPDDRPLFEGDVDEILGATAVPEEPEREKKAAVTGIDAMSLGEPTHQIVISGQKATLLMILVVVLMAISFAAGMFLAPHR